jgi:hypothetical protein
MRAARSRLRAGGSEVDTQEIGDTRVAEVALDDADHRSAPGRSRPIPDRSGRMRHECAGRVLPEVHRIDDFPVIPWLGAIDVLHADGVQMLELGLANNRRRHCARAMTGLIHCAVDARDGENGADDGNLGTSPCVPITLMTAARIFVRWAPC